MKCVEKERMISHVVDNCCNFNSPMASWYDHIYYFRWVYSYSACYSCNCGGNKLNTRQKSAVIIGFLNQFFIWNRIIYLVSLFHKWKEAKKRIRF